MKNQYKVGQRINITLDNDGVRHMAAIRKMQDEVTERIGCKPFTDTTLVYIALRELVQARIPSAV